MQLKKKTDVFNLMDTNGRRSDIINAYGIYLSILQQLEKSDDPEWKKFPDSLNQYKFYKKALAASPEVFKKHTKFDRFQDLLDTHMDLNKAFRELDSQKFKDYLKKYSNNEVTYSDLDKSIEARARHYTSNLVKIGFTDNNRNISSVGSAFVNGYDLNRDPFEELLPIKDGNLIFLRQLLKLKIYNKNYDTFYSPMLLVIFLLMNVPRIEQSKLLKLVVMINPNVPVDLSLIKKAAKGNAESLYHTYIDYSNNKKYIQFCSLPDHLDYETFTQYISNKKTKNFNKLYYQFYLAIEKYQQHGTADDLFNLYLNHTENIDSAFGFGEHLFKLPRGTKTLKQFIRDNKHNPLLVTKTLNKTLYLQYLASTRYVSIQEYSDTFRRLLKASGIVSFNNGIAELMYTNLWKKLLEDVDISQLIFGKCDPIKGRQDDQYMSSDFRKNIPISQIISIPNVHSIIIEIEKLYHINSAEEVKHQLLSQKDKEFKQFVKSNFPKEKVLNILALFADRTNDKKIKQIVKTDASVPTIYEYIVGLAWYYISDTDYNLYNSYNLSMNANFRPETHAAGGEGDIVIDYHDQILMLEVTLMNKQAQKRGEWEPVLRHTTNLTIESYPKKVQTLFIANELDNNTINIWRAVASVPMYSSKNTASDQSVNNVTIMPIKNDELCEFLNKNISSNRLLNQVAKSFEAIRSNFDDSWREKILNNTIAK